MITLLLIPFLVFLLSIKFMKHLAIITLTMLIAVALVITPKLFNLSDVYRWLGLALLVSSIIAINLSDNLLKNYHKIMKFLFTNTFLLVFIIITTLLKIVSKVLFNLKRPFRAIVKFLIRLPDTVFVWFISGENGESEMVKFIGFKLVATFIITTVIQVVGVPLVLCYLVLHVISTLWEGVVSSVLLVTNRYTLEDV